MTRESLRLRVARWLEPSVGQAPPTIEPVRPSDPGFGDPRSADPGSAGPRSLPAQPVNAWPEICDRYALHLLGLAEQLRPAMDSLEGDEEDPDRLQLLYQVDHAVTRMRRAARDMRILVGREDPQMNGYTSSLVDVLRVAESSIELYSQVSIGKMVDLAVVAYAAEDVASLLAALLDNATRYSPSTVTVSAHLLDNGGVMLRVEDTGIGIAPEHLAVLNAVLAGPVPEVDERTGTHTGFPLVHRLAGKHGLGVRLACRTRSGPNGSGGTIAMVAIPADLLCEIPDEAPAMGREAGPAPAPRPVSYGAPETGAGTRGHGEPARLTVAGGAASAPAGPNRAGSPAASPAVSPGALPRRERTSLRGVAKPAPASGPSAAAPEASAARRSFAEDLSAFAAGGAAGGAAGDEPDDEAGGIAPEPAGEPVDGGLDAADGRSVVFRGAKRSAEDGADGEDGPVGPEDQVRG
ncbi:ATP-binding protein [Actinomadura sp. HBU206391]|uniref:ATP-binding protein n=1 Tax=Actinomadura sp. HBU206391 TaxID=2731692 RepID=UPI00164F35FB|nr:ATP-binding protein [Actinomadura sp. HBU206391]MBC6459798.1 sensor histidine kinase [Actinomadura sp. HBU206391]